MTAQIQVLVTGIGSTTAQSVCKGLRAQEKFRVHITGTDINEPESIAGTRFTDEFYQIPPASNEARYVSALEDVVQTAGIDVIIPIVDLELSVLAAHREELERHSKLLLPDRETVETCNDKWKTHQFFEHIGVPTPKTARPEANGDVSDVGFPRIVKPRRGVSSRGVYEIQSQDEMCLIDRVEDPIIQERASGQEFTIDIFRWEGDSVAVPRKRLETRSGISYKGETVEDENLIETATRIADELELRGPANIQCFKSEQEVSFFEINPRFSGSLPLTIRAGVNSPRLALEGLKGEEVSMPQSFDEVRMCRYWEEVYNEY